MPQRYGDKYCLKPTADQADMFSHYFSATRVVYNHMRWEQEKIKKNLNNPIDVVMSDMAVNTTGIKDVDAIQTGELCKEAMVFSKDIISERGIFIAKIFMGRSFNEIVALGKKIFKEVKVFKPKSSRKDSKESFIICKNLR